MKIGILTFHCAHNYGAVLQAYALQQYLISLGHNVEIINIVPSFLKGYSKRAWLKCVTIRHPYRILKNLHSESKLYKLRKKRWQAFDSFIKNELYLSHEQNIIPDKYDAYIVGSDQVWNSKITKGLFPPYFCSFPFPKGKRIYLSYAASMESIQLSNFEKEQYRHLLKNFDYIGVREQELINVIAPLTEKKVHLTIDPTLLLDGDIWNKLAFRPLIKGKYVLLYRVWNDFNSRNIAKLWANSNGAKVIELVSWLDSNTNNNLFQAASPLQFVTLFKYADYIITDSFHGTSFSIIFKKDFYFVKVNNSQNRSESLLSFLGISDRIINKKDTPIFTQINYARVMDKLAILKCKSQQYLQNALCNKS